MGGIGILEEAVSGDDRFKKFNSSLAPVGLISVGDMLRKFRSCGIVVIGSPMGMGYCASFSDETDETVTRGAEPGNDGGGEDAPRRALGGEEGALFIRRRSRSEVFLGKTGCSQGVGGNGPVGGGARGPTEIGFTRFCKDDFDPILPLLEVLLCPLLTSGSPGRWGKLFVGGGDKENLRDLCEKDSRKDFMGDDLPDELSPGVGGSANVGAGRGGGIEALFGCVEAGS